MVNPCDCCNNKNNIDSDNTGKYICYCNKVTEDDIANAILNKGAKNVEEVISITGAMKNSNCKVNNPKGICCYSDIVATFKRYFKATRSSK